MMFPEVGSRLKQNTCAFTVWAPLKSQMEVVIEDTGVSHPMARDDHGYWTTEVKDIRRGTRYWFRIDREKKLPDPASRAQPEGVHGASAVVDSEFSWTEHEWKGLPLGDMIIYELHVGTFTTSGDFKGVISRLPYLQSLGVNAIELMPIAQFPGDRNWGYDGVFPFAVQNSYGSPEDLKALVNEAHNAGIAVILDVVYNHQGPEGNYLGAYGPYFTGKYKTGWGEALNFDDAWCDGVRNFYCRNALMWLDEYRIDGLRLDAVHAIWDFSANHFMEVLSENVRALEQRSGRKKVLIAEFDLNNPRYILPAHKGGYGLDGQWIDEFHHALHALITGETNGYYEDFGNTEHLVRAFRDAYVYTGQYSQHRKKFFGRKPEGTTSGQFVVFAQNHDQIGNRMLGDRLSNTLSKDQLKFAAAIYILSPYVPMLFMGEEYGETRPFQYFVSHGDKDLIEAVRKGRKEEFAYFEWQGEVPDPQSHETFSACMLSWDVDRSADASDLFSFYQSLITFRKNRPAMQGRSPEHVTIYSSEDLICMKRSYDQDSILVLMNFGKSTRSYVPDRQRKLRKLFETTTPEPDASHRDAVIDPGTALAIKPQSALILEYQ